MQRSAMNKVTLIPDTELFSGELASSSYATEECSDDTADQMGQSYHKMYKFLILLRGEPQILHHFPLQ